MHIAETKSSQIILQKKEEKVEDSICQADVIVHNVNTNNSNK